MSHAHSHAAARPDDPELRTVERRALGWMVSILVPIAVFTLVALVWLWPRNVPAHIKSDASSVMVPGVTMPKGTVTTLNEVSCEGMTGSVANDTRPCAKIAVHLDEGPDKGQTQEVQVTAEVYESGLKVGDGVKLYRMPSPQDGSIGYQFADFQRDLPLAFFALVFAVLVVAVARWRGFASLLGLVFAGFVMVKFLFPALIVGHNPTLVGLTASSAIMFVVLYAAHGFSTRTTTALVGTLFGLAISAGLGWWAARWAHLTGVASEDDFLLATAAPSMHLSSVVVCGVIIAGLGVLNDVTITQASAVWELAGTGRSRKELFTGAMRIGRDHIASTVYTTAFATAGAIMTVLLLLSIYQRPLVEVLTGEMFAGELVRTLVGSIGLVLAVPVTTAIAVAAVSAGQAPKPSKQIRPQPRVEQPKPEPARKQPARPAQHERGKDYSTLTGMNAVRSSRARQASHEPDLFKRPQGPDEV
ncbi:MULTISPECIES: YibE/F family protein [unclassified Luteococcus]|uniref:YibE/F family protein n=1 Tax=unclassified Luteococcus TaxID=2639923 RepID=UPI00313C4724